MGGAQGSSDLFQGPATCSPSAVWTPLLAPALVLIHYLATWTIQINTELLSVVHNEYQT